MILAIHFDIEYFQERCISERFQDIIRRKDAISGQVLQFNTTLSLPGLTFSKPVHPGSRAHRWLG